MELLRRAAAKYEKSHNFHNFTVGREFADRTVLRFMKNIEVRLALMMYSHSLANCSA